MPLPPGGPGPLKGLLHLILRHRFLVVALVVVLFFGSCLPGESWQGHGACRSDGIPSGGGPP